MVGITKKVSVIVGIILIIVIILHVMLFVFVNTKGRDLIVGSLKDKLGLEATMDSLSLKFPFNVEVKNFKCEVLSFNKANISLGFFNPFTRNIGLSQIYLDGLDLRVTKDKEGVSLGLPSEDRFKGKEKIVLSQNNLSSDSANIKIEQEKKEAPIATEEEQPESGKKNFSFTIGNLYIKNSRVEINYPLEKRPLNVVLNDFTLRLKGFTYPKVSRFYMKLDTVLVSPFAESQKTNVLGIEGWVDSNNKNMDLDLSIEDFDYIAFGKAYPPFWRPNNLRLKEAALSFKSNFKSKDNNLSIDNLLTIETVEFLEEEEGQGESFQAKILKTAIAFLKGDKEKPTLRFKLMTNMDSPKLDLTSLKKSLIEAAGIGPLTIIEGAIGEVTERFKGAGDATIGSVIETLKGATETIEGILKTDESEEQTQKSIENISKDEKAPQE